MQTPSSSSPTSSTTESPQLRRRARQGEEGEGGVIGRASVRPASSMSSGGAATPPSNRRLTMTLSKIPNFLTLNSPKKLQQQPSPDLKDKNEPSRFLGDGVSFKAKLIGILEVGEARGDRMCQEALADLKMAIRAAGEHKQRISITIAIDGLRLRDEKTMDCLYHHPVHKISFIAQDMTDSRAFGYIFGSPDTGHRFFGIKTDKAAGQVVVAMRDLFQVVFELKKKEIELAKQHIEQQQLKFTAGKSLENLSYPKNGASGSEAGGSTSKARSTREELRENGCIGAASKSAQQTSEVIADLLDLEIELNSIQQGIHQMEKITPSDPFGPEANREGVTASTSFIPPINDPFEDSFSPPIPSTSTTKSSKSSRSSPHPVLLPPPPSSTRSDLLHSNTTRHGRPSKRHPMVSMSLDVAPLSPPQCAPLASTETWFDSQPDPLFGDNELPSAPTCTNTTATTTSTSGSINLSAGTTLSTVSAAAASSKKEQAEDPNTSSQFDVFTELDPLGTGRSRPYVDKKDFFQELKNPPKKVLKELASEPKEGEPPPLFSANFESPTITPTTSILTSATPTAVFPNSISSPPLHSVHSVSTTSATSDILALDPFADTDPFGESDPFVEDDLPSSAASFPADPDDPFDTCFADFTMFGNRSSEKQASMYHGPLRVSLPPEKAKARAEAAAAAAAAASGVPSLLPPPPSGRRSSPIPGGSKPTPKSPKSPRITKQISAAASTLVRLPSPKQSRTSRRTPRQITASDNRSGSLLRSPPSPPRGLADGERLSNSSAELADIAPEPPPRPASSKPPPLPPKRQQQVNSSMKPPPRPPPSDQYDYINHHEDSEDMMSPPLPVPVRRPRSSGSEPHRARPQTSSAIPHFSIPPPPAPAQVREEKRLKTTGVAANLTLRQLTRMNITELASSLNVSPGHLAKMTLQELATFLASVSTQGSPNADSESSTSDTSKLNIDTIAKRDRYSALRESVDEETFKADFDSNFADMGASASATAFANQSVEDVFQEAPFDKYAVFRELLEQEGIEGSADEAQQEEEESVEVICEAPGLDEPTSPEVLADSDVVAAEQSDSGVTADQEDEEREEEEEEEEEGEGADKYAALRDICSVEPHPPDEESEKDDSVTEVPAEKMEDDFNLLTLSRQQSDSPDSPGPESTTLREVQSIIESTIMEEEVGSDTHCVEDLPVEPNADKFEENFADFIPESTVSEPALPTDRKVPPSELAIPTLDQTEQNEEDKEEGWAKFETGNFDSLESRSHNDDATSPWSLDGKEFGGGKVWRESPESAGPRPRRKRGPRRESPWQEEDEEYEEEEWDGRSHRENGWRDREGEHYDSTRPNRPRKHSPWGRGPRRTSPWEDEEDDDEDGEEEYGEVGYKSRPPPRGSSSERRSRRPPSWDDEEPEYDEPRPARRVTPGWAPERRRDFEDKRGRSGSRPEYTDRRRWEREEEEVSSNKPRHLRGKFPGGYATWGERGTRKPSQERRSRESAATRRKQFDGHYWHYRDQRPPPEWEYEDPEVYDSRYKQKKGGPWPKRPSSASDMRKGPVRRGFHSPGSSHSHDADQLEEDFVDRRFRTTSGEPLRAWLDEPHDFNSDQETEFHVERPRESYEQRSHTLHSKRTHKQKKNTRLSSEDFFSPQQKSPFEDDFSTHSFHASEFSSIDSSSADPGDRLRKQPDMSIRKDSQLSEPDLKLPPSSPLEDSQQNRGRESPGRNRMSRGSSRRQSPFEDDFTPPETRRGSARVPSSISSDVSEQRRSPHDDATTPSRGTHLHTSTRGSSLAVDDVFLPPVSSEVVETCEIEVPEQKIFEPRKIERRVGGWSEERPDSGGDTRVSGRQFAGMRSRLGVLRADSNASLKKSESVNIFSREQDPFDDDFFADSGSGHPSRPGQNKSKTRDAFGKWSEPFDNFDFQEENE